MEQLKTHPMKTILYPEHCRLGAKIVDFEGWQMPVHYHGVLHEHRVVREKAGIFDVSHMARIGISGSDAEAFLDFLSTNRIAGKKELTAIYTVWANEEGGSVDDVIVYRIDSKHFFIVVNAGNREKDLKHLMTYSRSFDVSIEPCYENEGIIALQGPNASVIMQKVLPDVPLPKPFRFVQEETGNGQIYLSGTGYTGSGGYEIYASEKTIAALWEACLEQGKKEGIEPIGLGARDTLRMEMGYALYGHELSEEISPAESVSAWTVKTDKERFIGKNAILSTISNPKKRNAYGAILLDKGVARQGYPIFQGAQKIGSVTSGTFAPSIEKAIALILVETPLTEGEQIEIGIRNKRCPAQIVKLPFYKPNK